jgi:hypothetical protein
MQIKLSDRNFNKPKRKHYFRFNSLFLVIALLPIGLLGIVNFTIDPYGLFKTFTLNKINLLKSRQDNNLRVYKAAEIINLKPQKILLGSSKVLLALDPYHPALAKNDSINFNLGIPRTHIYELRRYLEHAIANQPNLKQVVLGIDFFMFDLFEPNDFQRGQKLLGKTNIPVEEFASQIFSLDVLEDSQATFLTNQKETNLTPYFKNGWRDVARSDAIVQKTTIKKFLKNEIDYYLNNEGGYRNYKLSKESLQELKTIIQLCRDRHIDLKIFISPIHAIELESIRLSGLWSEMKDWKREIVKIIPLWDFSDYNSVNNEAIKDDMQYWFSSSHYSKEIGDSILNILFDREDNSRLKDLGVFITPNNLESQLQKMDLDAENWEKNARDWIKVLKSTKSIN